MKDSVRKLLILLAGIVAAVALIALMNTGSIETFEEKYAGVDLTADATGAVREGTYSRYLKKHQQGAYPTEDIEVKLDEYEDASGVEMKSSYEGESDVLYTDSDSSVTWKVNVPQAGFYNFYMEYMTVKSRGVAVERSIYINGELPFEAANSITLQRMWVDATDVRVDNQGNEIRATQVETFEWQKAFAKDDRGYVAEPYQFYCEEGENTVTLVGVNEPLALKSVWLKAVQEVPNYEEYRNSFSNSGATAEGLTYLSVVQGEDASVRSDSSLYAKYDRSSPSTQPCDVMRTVLNYTGGDAWKASGQWIRWDIEVPEDGFYKIAVKGRQNYARGSLSNRKLLLDGELPFEEAGNVSFAYANDWENKVLADAKGNAYEFYLTKGTHTLTLEAALGDVGAVLGELEDSIFRLNQIYRTVLVYIGASPDKYRDYNIDKVYPEVIEAMELESKRLYKIVDDMVAVTGQKADKIATAQTLAQQLERFVDRPDKISVEFVTFKDNITALGTASLSMGETKLDVDYITIAGVDAEIPEDKSSFMAKAIHEVKSFLASFIVDYDAVGDVYDADEEEVITVWVVTGRDQGTILKTMIDDTFTPNTGIKVNVEIVNANALMSAVVAGRGPNVVLSVGANQPVDFALRNAVEDLSQFEDIDEVLKAYTPSSYEQYKLEEHIYAIPETQNFNVMFYRKDILEQLGLEVPQTWQELIEMLPTIQGNNMSVGIPTAAGSSGATNATAVATANSDLSMYFTLLYQYGGDMYNEAGTETMVDSEAGIEAFEDYLKYFTDYGIPTIYDFVSRFRSGEMPIGIINYTTFNTLVVSAPEIRGLWEFTLIPGTERMNENGETYIDRSDFITGSATMMIKTEDEKLKNEAWEFMKWWADADTQVLFGREIEALLGSSARYATANIEAFEQLAWSAEDIEVLKEQWNQTFGIREVPGGYYTGRHITNAIRKVINEKTDPRETMIDYAITIDEEIEKKRIEFGLPVE
ncbi:MAG: extracellular solute-binding protein [Lachnospiraceae bacterium]|nr:extracellular solute-binding protein [Lachnospiraceae bacterium]